jgi:DNA replication and repair protein RecF
MDLVVAQSSRVYVEDVLEYRKALRQRNKILSDISRSGGSSALLDPWNETLVLHGSKVLLKRARFFEEFAPFVTRAYESVADELEIPRVEYVPNVATAPHDSSDVVGERFKDKLEEKKRDELRIGSTIVGPHRDEVAFSLNGLPLRAYASQGQHKTFLVALKVAEFFYLKERCAETPVVLLDDVFTELDDTRSQKLIALIKSLGQTFITTTSEHVLHETIHWDDGRRKFTIHNGAAIQHDHEAAT